MDERINQRGTGGVYCRRTKKSKTYFRHRKRRSSGRKGNHDPRSPECARIEFGERASEQTETGHSFCEYFSLYSLQHGQLQSVLQRMSTKDEREYDRKKFLQTLLKILKITLKSEKLPPTKFTISANGKQLTLPQLKVKLRELL